ncbi:MAG: hypothetical protein GY847_32655 [Proteobacteria bacterium]|nr:hypothetical protein [Pseudomonadota bacterium]
MSNGFQFFEGTRRESNTSPRITVRRGGLMVLTGAAVEMLGEGATHVRIGFNPKTKAVGICNAPVSRLGARKTFLGRFHQPERETVRSVPTPVPNAVANGGAIARRRRSLTPCARWRNGIVSTAAGARSAARPGWA